MVTVIFKTELEIWGVPPAKNLAAQKHQNFGLQDLIASISGREQDIYFFHFLYVGAFT